MRRITTIEFLSLIWGFIFFGYAMLPDYPLMFAGVVMMFTFVALFLIRMGTYINAILQQSTEYKELFDRLSKYIK